MVTKKSFPMPKTAPTSDVGSPTSAPNTKMLEQFISTGEVKKPSKVQISLGISTELLKRVDECADELGMSRAAYMNAVLSMAVKEGIGFGKHNWILAED